VHFHWSIDGTCSLCNLLTAAVTVSPTDDHVQAVLCSVCVKVCFWLLWPVAQQHLGMHMHVNGLKTPQAVNHFKYDIAVKMAALLQKQLSLIYSSNGPMLHIILKLSPTLTTEAVFCSFHFVFRTHYLNFFCVSNQFLQTKSHFVFSHKNSVRNYNEGSHDPQHSPNLACC
jgi:hypothetical protein